MLGCMILLLLLLLWGVAFMVNATVPTVGWEVWVTKRFYVRMRMYIMLAIPIVIITFPFLQLN